MPNYEPYNPLDKKNLGLSISHALTIQPALPIGELKQFNGAGIYMIYYAGEFEPYRRITELNADEKFEFPIYVGKAVPSGSRRGGNIEGSVTEPNLFKRLKEHAKSIEQSVNLDIEDFYCRFLVVDDIWIPLGEQLAIASFSPIWNQLIDGFGNHDPGSGRYKQARSKWDVLHPGRSWAERCPDRSESQFQIAEEAAAYLSSR